MGVKVECHQSVRSHREVVVHGQNLKKDVQSSVEILFYMYSTCECVSEPKPTTHKALITTYVRVKMRLHTDKRNSKLEL